MTRGFAEDQKIDVLLKMTNYVFANLKKEVQ